MVLPTVKMVSSSNLSACRFGESGASCTPDLERNVGAGAQCESMIRVSRENLGVNFAGVDHVTAYFVTPTGVADVCLELLTPGNGVGDHPQRLRKKEYRKCQEEAAQLERK